MKTNKLLLIPAFALLCAAGAARAQDAVGGKTVFAQQCAACHSPQPGRNLVGPSLAGVVGRAAGQVPGFHYSAANQASGLTWNAETLDRYLTAPSTVVPHTTMSFAGLKDDRKRTDLIAYLATLH